jgi:hypothetical protein
MVLTKCFKEGSFQTKGAFSSTKTFGWSLKSKLSLSEKNLRVIEMRTVDHLSEGQLEKLNYSKKKEPEQKKKVHHEHVDWEEIMGTKRDLFRRSKGGAISRR